MKDGLVAISTKLQVQVGRKQAAVLVGATKEGVGGAHPSYEPGVGLGEFLRHPIEERCSVAGNLEDEHGTHAGWACHVPSIEDWAQWFNASLFPHRAISDSGDKKKARPEGRARFVNGSESYLIIVIFLVWIPKSLATR